VALRDILEGMKATVVRSQAIADGRAKTGRAPRRTTRPSAAFESREWHPNELADSRPAILAPRSPQELANDSAQVRDAAQVQAMVDSSARVVAQRKQREVLLGGTAQKEANSTDSAMPAVVQARTNRTGLPDPLKAGVESLSGTDLSDVRVFFNSARPAQVDALAYTQGNEIHLGPGQERHLPHEAWHVVQQRQGRVQPTAQAGGFQINDDARLEAEADRMGQRASATPAWQQPASGEKTAAHVPQAQGGPIQRRMGIEAEMSVPAPVDGPATTAAERIRSFLGGSEIPGQNIQPSANGFEIETDHDQLGTEIEGARTFVNSRLGLLAQIPLAAAGHKVPNLEYKTIPYDEETATGRTQFLATVDAMAVDMAQKYTNGRTGQFVVNGYRIGMPVEQDWLDFANAVGIQQNTIQSIRNSILQRIRPNLYLQVTAGILPKKIAKHLNAAAGNRNVASLRNTIAHGADAMERLLTSGAVTTARRVLSRTEGLTRSQRNSNSLLGYLSLVTSYLYGNYVYYNGNTVGKNLVPFLSKTPLHRVQLELDTDNRPDQMTAEVRQALKDELQAAVVARVAEDDVAAFWPAAVGVHTGGPLGDWQNTWLPAVLEGNNVGGADAFTTGQLAGRTIAPEDHARSKQITPGPGRVARNPANADGTPDEYGGVIPLEFRHIESSPDPAGLRAYVEQVIAYVRRVNS
jgi:hypothetical protein